MSVLKLSYQNELYELKKWIDITSANLQRLGQVAHTYPEVQRTQHLIYTIAAGVQNDHPFYASTLQRLAEILFQMNGLGGICLNLVVFGELIVIIRHIEAEPVVVQFWAEIHPRIIRVSRELYVDGHYSTAAEKAVKEVETRLREKFAELKPNATTPKEIGDIIGALVSENGKFKFCDTADASGKNYRRGVQLLFEGIMAAYRNPAAHANLHYEKREAMEQIVLASQLMFVLDKPQLEQETV